MFGDRHREVSDAFDKASQEIMDKEVVKKMTEMSEPLIRIYEAPILPMGWVGNSLETDAVGAMPLDW